MQSYFLCEYYLEYIMKDEIKRILEKALIIPGNHELWAYPGLTVEEIVEKYSELTRILVIQNEIVLFEDTYEY